jgi:hypothetical protein
MKTNLYAVNYSATVRGKAYYEIPEGEDPQEHIQKAPVPQIDWDLSDVDDPVEWGFQFCYSFEHTQDDELHDRPDEPTIEELNEVFSDLPF